MSSIRVPDWGPGDLPVSTFTPEAVRDTLIAAGFTEHHRGDGVDEGFSIGDGRERLGEIIICWHSGGREWTSLESMWAADHAALEAYLAALAAAGFRARIEARRVIITGTAAAR